MLPSAARAPRLRSAATRRVRRRDDDGAVIAGDAARAIGRVVVDDDDLDELAGIVVAGDAGQAALQTQHVVPDGDDEGDERSHGRQLSKELAKFVQTRNSRRYALVSQIEESYGMN